jgi:hypothetical protein
MEYIIHIWAKYINLMAEKVVIVTTVLWRAEE